MSEAMIAYIRVSTRKQGESGLGLEGQESAIERHRAAFGGRLIKTYREVETGKRDELANRPELEKAIGHAKRSRARLVIAKLDRLARSVFVTSLLMREGVDFVACDNPHANSLTIHILAAVAEEEAKQISARTKSALAAYKTGKRISKRTRLLYPQGVPDHVIEATAGKLGASLPQCRKLSQEARLKGSKNGVAARRKRAIEAVKDLAPEMVQKWQAGESLGSIARWLNEAQQTTRRGRPWSPTQVRRVINRWREHGNGS